MVSFAIVSSEVGFCSWFRGCDMQMICFLSAPFDPELDVSFLWLDVQKEISDGLGVSFLRFDIPRGLLSLCLCHDWENWLRWLVDLMVTCSEKMLKSLHEESGFNTL